MKIGVHVSIANGLAGAAKTAKSIGCDGFQIFAGNPRGWARKPIADAGFASFRTERERAELWPVVVHLSYLPNLASSDQELYEKSVLTLVEDFERANRLGADFFVFHPGKTKAVDDGLRRISLAVNQVLERISGKTVLLFENQAGAGGEVAGSLKELGQLVATVKFPERVGICFDTCHAFAAGYDLRSESGWKKTLQELDQYVGRNFLKVFHLNDCKGELGSHLDRHQHIGEGQIGLEGFRFLVNEPFLSKLPGILETPQIADGDDRKNLATLRSLMKG
ncbi:endonuclease IV [Hydrogenispora ethanolica]|uniref:Probable endonuclease 4 n=1 Tax=Hydrogenispora ethanolica TaxID=1082276 RepID=A0A4R1QXV7_HYDET|nr:deoxyribonuclease IV [Hydrogenispora ethanolica]TCL57124.1 endonuclease IV [Hydrogenispora ethanolica]